MFVGSRESVRIRRSVLFCSRHILSFSCLSESLRPLILMHEMDRLIIFKLQGGVAGFMEECEGGIVVDGGG